MVETYLPSIYYLIIGQPRFGGQFVNQEHVQSLRKMGYRAYLLNASKQALTNRMDGLVPTLFLHGRMSFLQRDVVVLPEGGRDIFNYFANKLCEKVIHCQNPYYLFHGFDTINEANKYGAVAFLSCSSYTSSMLSQLGIHAPILTIPPAIPRQSVEPGKILQIAYMPRKRGSEASYIKGLFRSLYPQHISIPWVAIENLSRTQAFEVMRQSAIFASMSCLEGLGLPPLEAMSAECLVVGYDGFGGKSYARPDNGFWVEEGDHLDYVHSLDRSIEAYRDESWRAAIIERGMNTLSAFSQEAFEQCLLASWRRILGEGLSEFLLGSD